MQPAPADPDPTSPTAGASAVADLGSKSTPAVAGSTVDDDARSEGTEVSASTAVGDSIWSASDPEGAAVAAEDLGDSQPRERIHKRPERPPRDTAPKVTPQVNTKWTKRNAAVHIGNIGWFFGNWGKRPSDQELRRHFEELLKKQPAMVIGLAECQEESEDVLRAPPAAVAAPPAAVAAAGCNSFEMRPGYQYLTLRGSEESSVLVGVRQGSGNTLVLLDWERRLEGEYKRRSGAKGKAKAYSRSMIVKVVLDFNVGFFGKEHNVMVVHMHCQLAAGRFGVQKLKRFWDWLWTKILEFGVKVLMGDFNMSLFRVIPELRSRGAIVDMGAWYPWKSLEGNPMSDSCGIFFVNTPGVYTLANGLHDLHDRDQTGVLSWGVEVKGDPIRSCGDWRRL